MVGTPPILSLAALEAGIDIALEAPMAAVRAKSLRLADLFIALMAAEAGFRLLTPSEPSARGSQVAFAHPHGYAIMQALIERGVIGDFRAPDVLRFGLAPLYVRFVDVWDAVAVLRDVMRSGAWRDGGPLRNAARCTCSLGGAAATVLRLVLQRLGQPLRIDLDLHAGPLQLAQHDRA